MLPVDGQDVDFAVDLSQSEDFNPSIGMHMMMSEAWETTIEVGTEVVSVRARVARGEERDRIWDRQTQLVPAMGDYGRRAGRRIPVVILEPT